MSHSRISLLCVALLFAGHISSPLSAASLQHRISLDLAGAEAADVLNSFGKILELPVEADPAISGQVTIRLQRVTVGTVMSAVCESIGCEWEVSESEAGRVLRFRPAPAPEPEVASGPVALTEKIDMSFAEAPARVILKSFASMLQSELRTDCPGVEEKVSLEVESFTVADAIDLVCEKIDCECRVEPGVLAATSAGP